MWFLVAKQPGNGMELLPDMSGKRTLKLLIPISPDPAIFQKSFSEGNTVASTSKFILWKIFCLTIFPWKLAWISGASFTVNVFELRFKIYEMLKFKWSLWRVLNGTYNQIYTISKSFCIHATTLAFSLI